MKTLGAFEAKTHFGELLREVERGESFEITRRNRPVARLVGVDDRGTEREATRMLDRVRKLRRTLRVSQEEILEWIREGRR